MVELENLVKNKIVGVALHGKSIEELEERIELFKDLDIVWVSLNAFDIIETYILNKINKKLSLIYCLADYWPEIEKNIRIPLLIEAINRGSLMIAKKYLFENIFPENGAPDFFGKYRDKIFLIEDFIDINHFSIENLLSHYTVSSLGYILSTLSILKAKKIILFGCDGGIKNDITSYYKSDIHIERRVLAPYKLKDFEDGMLFNIQSDTDILNTEFWKTYLTCMTLFNITPPPILNCSPNSYVTTFPIITYDSLLKEHLCQ